MFVKQQKTALVFLALTLVWIFSSCAYQQPRLQQAPEEPPPAVEIKPGTPVSEPMTPVEPESETAVIAPKTSDLEKPTTASRFFLHKVIWPEETLSHIAKWYTGKAKNWEAIVKLNPELDPKRIDIGDTISIPEDLLTTRKPMPHFFVQPASVHKKRTPQISSKEISSPPESPKLFGPIVSEPLAQKTDQASLFGPVEPQQPSIETDKAKLFGPID